MSANIHVVHRDDGWAVLREGGADLLSHLSEDEAVDVGREIARLERVGFFIFDSTGRMRERYSYEQLGKDKYP